MYILRSFINTKKSWVFLLLATTVFSFAQEQAGDEENTIRIESIKSHNFPEMKAYVSVETEEGETNLSLVKGNFSAKIDTEDPVRSLEVETFNKLEEPVHYVFFLSASGLMDGPALSAQKKAVLDFSTSMREIDTLSVYMVEEQPRELFAYANPLDFPQDAIQSIEVSEEQTKIFDTLVAGIRKIEKDRQEEILARHERVVFIIVSDGRDNESRYTLEQTGQILSENGIPLYAVGLKVLSEASLSMLHELAKKSGGFYYYTPEADSISDNLGRFSQQINMSYVVSFRSKGVKADDSFHQLMVQVDDKDQSIQAFLNFKAVKTPFPFWLKITLAAGALVLVLLTVFLMILGRIRLRKRLGITKRRCPDCKRRMKDDWEFCPFCRYLPPKKKKRRNRDEESA